MEYIVGMHVLGDWKIVRKLGQGVGGQVFEIQKEIQGVTLKSALKIICIPQSAEEIGEILKEGVVEESLDEYYMQVVQKTLEEVKRMAKLKNHKNIVKYEECCLYWKEHSVGGDILIRMELLQSLREYQMEHHMKEYEVYRMAEELCSALAYCHANNLIHGDIKPENIFISETGCFKLGDIGVTRTIKKMQAGFGENRSENYMAPEIYMGKAYDNRVDIYSLGLVLYKIMNFGRLPFFPDKKVFAYAEREEALGRRMNGEALPLLQNTSKEFGDIILRACAYDVNARYQAAEQMLADLQKKRIEREKTKENNEQKGLAKNIFKINYRWGILAGTIVLAAVMTGRLLWVNKEKLYGTYKKVNEIVKTNEDTMDLSSYLGKNLKAVSKEFVDMEYFWLLGVANFHNEELSFGSTRNDMAITVAEVKSAASDYKIQGIYIGMDMKEAKTCLMENGFSETMQEGVYWNGQNYYVNISNLENEEYPRINIEAVLPIEYENRTEVAYCFGKSFALVMEKFTDLILSEKEGKVVLHNEFLRFEGRYGEGKDVESVMVDTICLSDEDSPYCIYGLYPGIDRDIPGEVGLSKGGSGEYVDPMGNVIYLGGMDDKGRQQIEMYKPG